MILTLTNKAIIVSIALRIIEDRKLKGVEILEVELHSTKATLLFSILDNNQQKAVFVLTMYNDGEIMGELSGVNDFNSLAFYPDHIHKVDTIMNILESVVSDYE